MPLPASGQQWPPKPLDAVRGDFDRWSAWYSGDPTLLERAYRDTRQQERPSNRPSTYRGGIVGAVARTFWGAPRTDLTQPKRKLHVPLAGDICQASADLLFSEPPTLKLDDDPTQQRVTELVGDGMLSTLAEAAELGAALGGTYLRVTWDDKIRPDAPFATAVDSDGAWPEFRWGQLTAVTFWTVVSDPDNNVVTRHLERHELTADGRGIVLHGMYQGSADNLGRPIELTTDVVGDGVMANLADGQVIDTKSPGLAVIYVPNQRPQRRWRTDTLGRNLGRSDLDGIEGLMDALDETYTSWMRDVRLGKARVFVAQSLLEGNGPGRGAMWDDDQEVYAPLDMLAPRDTSGMPIQAEQFKIRFAEHESTARALVENALRTAGYSTATFGMDSELAGDTTATEIVARQQRSYMTRDRKMRLWRPALADLIQKLLAVDEAIFGSQVKPARPDVIFPDGVQDSQLTLAQTAQALRAAEAASTETLVGMVHPDWDDEQVGEEVDRIRADVAAAHPPMPDPSTFTGGLGDPAGA